MLNVGNEGSRCATGLVAAQLPAGRHRRAGVDDAADPAAAWRRPGRSKEPDAKIRNCITIFLVGSPGQLDTWDMKPDAPAEVRGKFKPIKTERDRASRSASTSRSWPG